MTPTSIDPKLTGLSLESLLDILPNLGEVDFNSLKKSFLSTYGLDLPVPKGSRSVKSPLLLALLIPLVSVLDTCNDPNQHILLIWP